MDIQQLRCFLAVAREGHFGRAAEQLHLTTSPVSRAVKDLERDLGGDLFVRRYHHIELTAAGRHLLARLEPVVADFDQLRAEVRQLVRPASRALRIGAPSTAPGGALDAVVDAAETLDPGCPIEVILASSAELFPAVASGDIDLAVVHLDLAVAPHLPIADLGLDSVQLIAYTMMAVLRADDPLIGRGELRSADLADRTFVVMVDSAQRAAIQHMRGDFAARGVVRVETLPADDITMLVAKVRRRGSFTLVARESDMGRMFDEADFARVPAVDLLSRGVGVVWRVADRRPDGRVAAILSQLGAGGAEAERSTGANV